MKLILIHFKNIGLYQIEAGLDWTCFFYVKNVLSSSLRMVSWTNQTFRATPPRLADAYFAYY